jgi:hypothetical protein
VSTPPVSTSQLNSAPIISTTMPTNTGAQQEPDSEHPSTSSPPVMMPNQVAPQPGWLNEWHTHVPTEVASDSSSSASSFQSSSSSIALAPRQTAAPVETVVCLESLPPEGLFHIFTQLQEPRLFNASLSNVAKTSKLMRETAISFVNHDREGRKYKFMHKWADNIQAIRENCSEEKFSISSNYILRLADLENSTQNAEADIYKLESICLDFSSSKHWDFQIGILSQMNGAFIKINASTVGMEALKTRIFPALENSVDSNILMLDLSSNALSAGNAIELFKMMDKKNNLYRINLSDNPNFSDNPEETKEFFSLLFEKIRPLSHLRLKNTGFNDVCAKSICDSLKHPHLLQLIELDQHNASDNYIEMLRKSLQKNTAELSYFINSTASIYSISAKGILADNIDVNWNLLEQEYNQIQEEFFSTRQAGMYSDISRKLRHHPIGKLHDKSSEENDWEDDNNDFDDVLPVD